MSDDDADGLTLRELLAQTTAVLQSPHEARWFCEVASAADGDDFDAALDEPVTQRMVAHLDSMVARYRGGEPLQYALGRWAFRHLDLAVDRRVLIPRPETEMVAGVAIDLARRVDAPRLIADLGTGSGAIGLSLAHELPLEGTTVWITDVSDDAIAVARSNLAGLGRGGGNVRVNVGSWFEALPDGQRFDVIVSNPPYVAVASPDLAADVRDWEPHGALFAGPDGLDDLRVLIAGAPNHLAEDGWLVLEIGADQGASVNRLLIEHGYRRTAVKPDLAGRDRVALGQAPLR